MCISMDAALDLNAELVALRIVEPGVVQLAEPVAAQLPRAVLARQAAAAISVAAVHAAEKGVEHAAEVTRAQIVRQVVVAHLVDPVTLIVRMLVPDV
jgi:hypothetical protein